MESSNIFWSVQTAISLLGRGARDRGARAGTWYAEAFLPALQTGLSHLGSNPKLMAQKVRAELPLFPVTVFFLFPRMGHVSQRSEAAGEACAGSLLMSVAKFQHTASVGICDCARTHRRVQVS